MSATPENAGEGQMPGASMEGSASDREMPSGGMDEPPSGSDEMPSASMEAGEGSGRFPAEGWDPGRVMPQWEAGVVEVELRDDVRPELHPGITEVRAPSGAPVDELNLILRRHHVLAVEPSFDIPAEDATAAQELAASQGIRTTHLQNYLTLHFPPNSDTAQIAEELNRLESVERAVPVPIALPPDATVETAPAAAAPPLRQVPVPAIVPPPGTPLNEPRVGSGGTVVVDPVTGLQNQWYVFRCRIDEAWGLGASGKGVAVADIDWGYRLTHEDLKDRLDLANRYNAYDGGTNVSHGAHVSHGTAVMGLAGAADNDRGMAGIAYSADLWPIQANSGPGAPLGGNPWARAIDWVRTRPSGGKRKVLILEVQTGTYGNYEMVPSVNAAIKLAIASGVVCCVAAGNGNRSAAVDDLGNPIPATGSILVGATAYHPTQNPRASFSNYGPNVVVSAPGDGSHDLTCGSGSDTQYINNFGGTSGATPKVAAVAAMMLEVNPGLTHAQVRDILKSTGSPVVTDAAKPVGTFLNAAAAVRAARPAAWRPFTSLGGVCVHGPALASWAPNRLDAFVIGTGGALFHKYWNGSAWSGFSSLGGVCVAAPAAVARDTNRLDVFVIGTDSALYQKSWTGASWTAFTRLGGVCNHAPAAATWGPGRLDVFVIGTDNRIYHKVWNGSTWGPFQALDGTFIAGPAAVARGVNRLDLFAIGINNALYHRTFNGTSWSGWTSLGGRCKLGVAATAWSESRLDAFTIGMDNAVYQKTLQGTGWSGWQRLGGVCISAPAAVAPAPNRIDLLVYGTNSALYHRSWS